MQASLQCPSHASLLKIQLFLQLTQQAETSSIGLQELQDFFLDSQAVVNIIRQLSILICNR